MSGYFFKTNDFRIKVDLAPQVLCIEADKDINWNTSGPSPIDDEFQMDEFSADKDYDEFSTSESKPFCSITEAQKDSTTTPLMAFAHKAKQFNDWLYSTLDAAAFLGDCPVVGKQAFIQHLVNTLNDTEEILDVKALLYAAESLGTGSAIEGLSGKLRLRVKKHLKSFEADSVRSNPIGFYSESKMLQRLFRHDRILQSEIKSDEANLLAAAITDANLSESYNWHLRASSRLTGQHAKLPVTAPTVFNNTYALFPPSRAPETDLMKILYGNRPIPEGFRLLDEVIIRVKDNRLSLKPSEDDGWYLRELYALETLLKSDNDRLQIGVHYRESLEQLFKGLMSLSRETHIKQLEVPMCGTGGMFTVPEVEVAPRIRLEPFPEYYQRMANNYTWLLEILYELWGEPYLPHKVSKKNGQQTSVIDALYEMRTLFLGAYYLCLEDLGDPLPDPLDGEIKLAMVYARQFLANWKQDSDICTDSRMMVPLYYDIEKKKTRVSVVCGYLSRDVAVEFARHPEVHATDSKGNDVDINVTWSKSGYKTVYPIQFECDVVQVLDRESLREIANKYPVPNELHTALEKLP